MTLIEKCNVYRLFLSKLTGEGRAHFKVFSKNTKLIKLMPYLDREIILRENVFKFSRGHTLLKWLGC